MSDQENIHYEKLQESLYKQGLVVERLLSFSESQSKLIDSHERWIEKHDVEYHKLDSEVALTKSSVVMMSAQLTDLKDALVETNTTLKKMSDMGLKISGGWITLSVVSTFLISMLTLLHSFGVF